MFDLVWHAVNGVVTTDASPPPPKAPVVPPPSSPKDHPVVVFTALGNGYFLENGDHLVAMGPTSGPAPIIVTPKQAGAPPATGNDYDVMLHVLVQNSFFGFDDVLKPYVLHVTPGIGLSAREQEAALSHVITLAPPT